MPEFLFRLPPFHDFFFKNIVGGFQVSGSFGNQGLEIIMILLHLPVHLLDSMEIGAKGENNNKGCGVDRPAEGRDMFPGLVQVIEQQDLFDQMAERTGDGKEYDCHGKEEDIMPEGVFRLLHLPFPGKIGAPERNHQGDGRACNINDYDRTPGNSHENCLHFFRARSRKRKEGTSSR